MFKLTPKSYIELLDFTHDEASMQLLMADLLFCMHMYLISPIASIMG